MLVALAEAAMGGAYAAAGIGATLDLERYADGVALDALLYGEDAGRVVVSADPANGAALTALAAAHRVPISRAGVTGGRALELRAGSRLFNWDVAGLRRTYFDAIPRRMQHADAERSAGE